MDHVGRMVPLQQRHVQRCERERPRDGPIHGPADDAPRAQSSAWAAHTCSRSSAVARAPTGPALLRRVVATPGETANTRHMSRTGKASRCFAIQAVHRESFAKNAAALFRKSPLLLQYRILSRAGAAVPLCRPRASGGCGGREPLQGGELLWRELQLSAYGGQGRSRGLPRGPELHRFRLERQRECPLRTRWSRRLLGSWDEHIHRE